MEKVKDIAAYNTIMTLENANHQLLENQSFLHAENQRLQQTVADLNLEIEDLRSTMIPPATIDQLQAQNRQFKILNCALKKKLKQLKRPPQEWSEKEIERDKDEQKALRDASENLDVLVRVIKKQSERLEIRSNLRSVAQTMDNLKEKLEMEERRNSVNEELLRSHWENDEVYVLQDKISDLRRTNDQLQVEGAKRKFQLEDAQKEIDRLKIDLEAVKVNLADEMKKIKLLENERDVLKQNITVLENANLALKREMIEELNEANRAKRVCIDTEIALKQIKDAFEEKRHEVVTLTSQLSDALNTIRTMSEDNRLLESRLVDSRHGDDNFVVT